MEEFMLTTMDNPFNPFTHYKEWYQFDAAHSYHTPSFLARIARTSDDLSEPDQLLAIDQAMNEIVAEDVLDLYVKVSRETASIIVGRAAAS